MNGKARPLETFPRGGGVGTARRFATLHRGGLKWTVADTSSTASGPPCLAAARARLGSDSHSDCHSLPRRRFATRWRRLILPSLRYLTQGRLKVDCRRHLIHRKQVSLRLVSQKFAWQTEGKTIINRFLTPSCRFATLPLLGKALTDRRGRRSLQYTRCFADKPLTRQNGGSKPPPYTNPVAPTRKHGRTSVPTTREDQGPPLRVQIFCLCVKVGRADRRDRLSLRGGG